MSGKDQTITVRLSAEWAEHIQRILRDGEYASKDAIIAEALEIWAESRSLPGVDAKVLKRAYDDGIASGAGREITAAAFLRELKAGNRKRG